MYLSSWRGKRKMDQGAARTSEVAHPPDETRPYLPLTIKCYSVCWSTEEGHLRTRMGRRTSTSEIEAEACDNVLGAEEGEALQIEQTDMGKNESCQRRSSRYGGTKQGPGPDLTRWEGTCCSEGFACRVGSLSIGPNESPSWRVGRTGGAASKTPSNGNGHRRI